MSRRRLRVAVILFGILAAGYLIAGWGVGHLAANRLADRMHAQYGVELRWSWAWYHMPTGLSLHDVSVVMPGRDGRPVQLLHVDYFRSELQGFPHAGRPMRLRYVLLDQPLLHIERQSNGAVLRPGRLSRPAGAPPAPTGFTIQRADIHGGRIEYQNDLSAQTPFSITLPDATVAIRQSAGQLTTFDVNSSPSAHSSLDVQAAGSLDARKQLTLTHFLFAGNLADAKLVLPASAQRLHLDTITGPFRLETHGSVNLNSPAGNNWTGAFTLNDASAAPYARLPARHISMQLALVSSTTPGVLVRAEIQHLDADSDGASLHVGSGKIQVDADGWKVSELLGWLDMDGERRPADPAATQTLFDRWRLRGRLDFTATASAPYRLPYGSEPLESIDHVLLAYPRNVALRPPKFPKSFEQIGGGGSVSLRAGIISFDHLHAKYGDDKILLDSGRLILEDPRLHRPSSDLRRHVELADITSTILVSPTSTTFPRAMAPIMARLHPLGAFGVSGSITFPVHRPEETTPLPPDYHLAVTSTGDAQLILFDRVKLDAIQGSAILTPKSITIPNVQGIIFGGSLQAQGIIGLDPVKHATTFEGQLTASNLQLSPLASALKMKPELAQRLAGVGGLHAAITDTITPHRSWYHDLQGSGEFEAFDGAFATLPVVSDVEQHSTTPPASAPATIASSGAPLTVDEAAGVFTLGDQRINFSKAAISSPLIGLEGAGSIGFDRSLDMNFVIAPLGNWKQKAKDANIPFISDVAGDVLGAVQKIVNLAQGSLINAVHVGGTLAKPAVQDTPAPALTDGLKNLFGQMLQPRQSHRLLNAVRVNPTK